VLLLVAPLFRWVEARGRMAGRTVQ